MTDQTTGAEPTLLFINVHKGGSTFVEHNLGVALERAKPDWRVVRVGSELMRGAAVEDLEIPVDNALIVRLYPGVARRLSVQRPHLFDPARVRLAIMYRDPRDVAVSMYYSDAFSHSLNVNDPDRLLKRRASLREQSLINGVASCADRAIAEFRQCLRLAEHFPHALVCTYEDMVTDYGRWLRDLAAHAGWSRESVNAIHAATHAELRPPDVVDPYAHKRRVTPGNWREVFDDGLRSTFAAACDDDMTRAGYSW